SSSGIARSGQLGKQLAGSDEGYPPALAWHWEPCHQRPLGCTTLREGSRTDQKLHLSEPCGVERTGERRRLASSSPATPAPSRTDWCACFASGSRPASDRLPVYEGGDCRYGQCCIRCP